MVHNEFMFPPKIVAQTTTIITGSIRQSRFEPSMNPFQKLPEENVKLRTFSEKEQESDTHF